MWNSTSSCWWIICKILPRASWSPQAHTPACTGGLWSHDVFLWCHDVVCRHLGLVKMQVACTWKSPKSVIWWLTNCFFCSNSCPDGSHNFCLGQFDIWTMFSAQKVPKCQPDRMPDCPRRACAHLDIDIAASNLAFLGSSPNFGEWSHASCSRNTKFNHLNTCSLLCPHRRWGGAGHTGFTLPVSPSVHLSVRKQFLWHTLCPACLCYSAHFGYVDYPWGVGVHGYVILLPWRLILEI